MGKGCLLNRRSRRAAPLEKGKQDAHCYREEEGERTCEACRECKIGEQDRYLKLEPGGSIGLGPCVVRALWNSRLRNRVLPSPGTT